MIEIRKKKKDFRDQKRTRKVAVEKKFWTNHLGQHNNSLPINSKMVGFRE
jgi:hypothetical protein